MTNARSLSLRSDVSINSIPFDNPEIRIRHFRTGFEPQDRCLEEKIYMTKNFLFATDGDRCLRTDGERRLSTEDECHSITEDRLSTD